MKKIIVYEMEYEHLNIPKCSIECIPFDAVYFREYMKIYNDCFYEMRKALDIHPYSFLRQHRTKIERQKRSWIFRQIA